MKQNTSQRKKKKKQSITHEITKITLKCPIATSFWCTFATHGHSLKMALNYRVTLHQVTDQILSEPSSRVGPRCLNAAVVFKRCLRSVRALGGLANVCMTEIPKP